MAYRLAQKVLAAGVLGTALAAGAPDPTLALDVDAGDYVAAPPGTSLAIGYGLFGWSNDFTTQSGDNVSNSKLNTQVGVLRMVHFFDIGITIDPQIFIVYGSANNAQLGGTNLSSSTGFGDTILASTFWLVNQPEEKRWFGITPFFYLPTGTYRDKQAINLGENRFKQVLQAGFVQGMGDWTVDLIADTTFYQNNNDAGPNGDQTLRQDNSYSTQAWLRYGITPEWDVGGGWVGSYGGVQKVAGDKNGLSSEYQRLRFISQFWPKPDWQLQGIVQTDVYRQGGFQENLGIQLKLMKVF